MVRQDYIIRMIEKFAEILRDVVSQNSSGHFDEARKNIAQTCEELDVPQNKAASAARQTHADNTQTPAETRDPSAPWHTPPAIPPAGETKSQEHTCRRKAQNGPRHPALTTIPLPSCEREHRRKSPHLKIENRPIIREWELDGFFQTWPRLLNARLEVRVSREKFGETRHESEKDPVPKKKLNRSICLINFVREDQLIGRVRHAYAHDVGYNAPGTQQLHVQIGCYLVVRFSPEADDQIIPKIVALFLEIVRATATSEQKADSQTGQLGSPSLRPFRDRHTPGKCNAAHRISCSTCRTVSIKRRTSLMSFLPRSDSTPLATSTA